MSDPKYYGIVPNAPEAGLPASWNLETDQTDVIWNLPTGPYLLSDLGLNPAHLAQSLLGINLADLPAIAEQRLQPYRRNGKVRQQIIMGSASETIGAYAGEYKYLSEYGRGIGIDPAIATRDTYFAKAGDLVVGRSYPFRETVSELDSDISTLDLGQDNDRIYYTSHTLLYMAYMNDPRLQPLIDTVRNNPEAVVRVYTLDVEVQLFLLWLANQAGVEQITVESNSPSAAEHWNHKAILYPTVTQARQINTQHLDLTDVDCAYQVLMAEGQLSQIGHELHIDIPRIPGYVIENNGDYAQFWAELLAARDLLTQRYGIPLGCLKLAHSSDGTGIIAGIDLNNVENDAEMAAKIEKNYVAGDRYVLESHMHYAETEIAGEIVRLVPSVHLNQGHAESGKLSMQFTNAKGEWRGNISVDESNCEELGLSLAQFYQIQTFIHNFVANLDGRGIIKGGFDLGKGSIGGIFGDRLLLGIQDPNLRTNGAETMYRSLAKVREITSQERLQVATRVLSPQLGVNRHQIQEAVNMIVAHDPQLAGVIVDIIAIVPPGWGMISASGERSLNAAQNVIQIEHKLREINLVA